MTLYLYEEKNPSNRLTLEDVVEYTDSHVILADGTVYESLADGWELSENADCSRTLRAIWREENPLAETRLEELELMVAELLFGGEGK